ncbi:MAG: hypothetical protein AAF170_03240 [Bacteroidota bacterium]
MPIRTLLLILLAGVATGLVDAQPIQTLASSGFHPVTSNGRVIWTNGPTPDAQTLFLWDGAETTTVDTQISGALVGWPDLDATGAVAYVKVVSGRYELMVRDADGIRQITRSGVQDSDVDLGRPNDELKGGFPRISGGSVVFMSADGDVHLYEPEYNVVRTISTRDDQRASVTTQEQRAIMQMTGIKPVFEFDGQTIVWKNQSPGGGQSSTFTIWRADELADWRPRSLASFEAATPREINAAIAGVAGDPDVVACGDDVAWTYRAPASIPAGVPAQYQGYLALDSDVIVGYHDGTEVKTLAQGDILPLSLAVSGGNVGWVEKRESGDREFSLVQTFARGMREPVTVKTSPDPPAQAPNGADFWTSPIGLQMHGSEMVWFEDRVTCEAANLPGVPEGYCIYKPAEYRGVFSRSSPSSPGITSELENLMPGGSFDRGRYAWRAFDNSIKTTELIEGIQDGGVQLVDLLPNRVRLAEESRTRVVDVFAISATEGGGECSPGDEDEEGATITGLTLSIEAESGVLADLSDIESLRIVQDTDRDGRRGEGEPVLADVSDLSASQPVVFGEPVDVTPEAPAVFLVELQMREATEICPCNRYTVTLNGTDVDAGTSRVQGQSMGTLILPPPTLALTWADAQAGLPGSTLPESFGFGVDNFPERCGQARFRLVNQNSGDDAVLLDEEGGEQTEIILPFDENEGASQAEVDLRLGSEPGRTYVEASIVFPEGSTCESPTYTFVHRAGEFALQVVDANNPDFTEHVVNTSHSDYRAWDVSMSSDPSALAVGGERRVGATADGASPLLLRAHLLGFTEAPEGEVTFALEGSGDMGSLVPALGAALPAADGASTVSSGWHDTPGGIVAYALYTPPPYFADESPDRLAMRFSATFPMPETGELAEDTQDAYLFRPPVLLTHGMWSNPGTWGEAFTGEDARFDRHLVDYSDMAAWDFSQLGHVMQDHVGRAISARHRRGIAATKVDVVAHSMGGLITRQYIGESEGRNYRRPDNLGQGDIQRLITIGTPHFGSPVAWLAYEARENLVAATFTRAIEPVGFDVYSGAIDAMCPGSPQLMGLGTTHVPTHTVRAWHLDTSAENIGWGTLVDYLGGIDGRVEQALEDYEAERRQTGENESDARNSNASSGNGRAGSRSLTPRARRVSINLIAYTLRFLGELSLETSVQGVFGSDRTDYLVTLASQGGGIAQGQNAVFDKTLHMAVPSFTFTDPRDGETYEVHGETTRQEIATYVFDLLHQDPEDISVFAPRIPKPIVDYEWVTCN